MSKEEIKHTSLCIKERSRAEIDGVICIDSFDDGYVSLSTSEGTIYIEGQGLKIESLIREGGEIEITGKIISVGFTEKKKRGGLMAKFFG